MRPPSAAQSRAVAVAPAPRGFPVVACLESIARGTRCLLLTHTSIIDAVNPPQVLDILAKSRQGPQHGGPHDAEMRPGARRARARSRETRWQNVLFAEIFA